MSRMRNLVSPRGGLPALASDIRGGIAVSLALVLPVLFGFSMLVIDGGRYFNFQTSLQASADALALVGAAELDGRPDAIDRANRAMANLVSNDQRFGSASITTSNLTVRYLSSLPTSDATAIPAASVTTDPRKAGFIQVGIAGVPFSGLFAAAASAVSSPKSGGAKAVAGFDSVACNVTPLFMCNPFEGTSTSIFVGANDPTFKRRLIAMKAKGKSYGPGNYGYLEPASGNGGAAVKDALAVDKPKGCYRQSGVELQTGNISSTAEAMNVRFDLYAGNFGGKRGDVSYRPARNVRKGFTGPACNAGPDYDPTLPPTDKANAGKALGLPRDACFYAGTCAYGGTAMAGRIGDGNWDFETYWTRTYGTAFPNGWSNANRPSRYDVYRHEIDNNLMPIPTVNAVKGETGAPMCYSGGPSTLSDDPDRRTFVGAMIDCQAADAAGQLTGSSGGAIPVTAYARFFMTEPMDKNDGTIWAELVELVEPGTAAARNVIRDSVQLYR